MSGCLVWGWRWWLYRSRRDITQSFNKKGALIDAKEIDAVNPERASAGTQFCFVQGKVLDDKELAEKEARINEIRRNWL